MKRCFKQILLAGLLFLALDAVSQTLYENDSKVYSFTMPANYTRMTSNHQRNEFVFVERADTTSLVVNVNDRVYDKNNMEEFKKSSNEEIETNYFNVLKAPKIMKRGELETYKDYTIFFHVTHNVSNENENNYMLTYLFYNKGKEVNFIFRTKAARLEKVLPRIEAIVTSVKLL